MKFLSGILQIFYVFYTGSKCEFCHFTEIQCQYTFNVAEVNGAFYLRISEEFALKTGYIRLYTVYYKITP